MRAMKNRSIFPRHNLRPTGALCIRRCLRCDLPFPSTAQGYRICPLCRKRRVRVDERMLQSWGGK